MLHKSPASKARHPSLEFHVKWLDAEIQNFVSSYNHNENLAWSAVAAHFTVLVVAYKAREFALTPIGTSLLSGVLVSLGIAAVVFVKTQLGARAISGDRANACRRAKTTLLTIGLPSSEELKELNSIDPSLLPRWPDVFRAHGEVFDTETKHRDHTNGACYCVLGIIQAIAIVVVWLPHLHVGLSTSMTNGTPSVAGGGAASQPGIPTVASQMTAAPLVSLQPLWSSTGGPPTSSSPLSPLQRATTTLGSSGGMGSNSSQSTNVQTP